MNSTRGEQSWGHRAASWFRVIAFAEALSWVGLLIGMYVKYAGSPRNEIGVKIFGPIHGGIFIAFVIAAVLVGIACSWRPVTWILALLGSIVPLGSVAFLIWVERTGRMAPTARTGTAQPDRSVPEPT